MSDRSERITINPEQCGTRPCVRGMRIRVTDVLELFPAGLSAEQILKELPDLEPEELCGAQVGSSHCCVMKLWLNAQLSPEMAAHAC